jgi:hypothetical protein
MPKSSQRRSVRRYAAIFWRNAVTAGKAQTYRGQPSADWVAHALICATDDNTGQILYVASSERRAYEIGRALRQFAPDIEFLALPAWDSLPFDCAANCRMC